MIIPEQRCRPIWTIVLCLVTFALACGLVAVVAHLVKVAVTR